MRNTPKNKRRPSLEALEPRALLAGNVSVSLSSNNILITGDNLSNSVTVFQTSLDNYRVVGNFSNGSSTRINGSSTNVFNFRLSSFNNDIRIVMNGGNDSVTVRGNDSVFGFGDLDAPEDLDISMGSGNDSVTLQFVEAQRGDVRVSLGTGTDTVTASDVRAADDFTVTSSFDARVTANLNRVFVDDLIIDLSNSADIVNINNSDVNDLVVDLFSGDDRLSIKRTRVRVRSDLDGGSGNDDLNLFANIPSSLTRVSFKTPTARDINYI